MSTFLQLGSSGAWIWTADTLTPRLASRPNIYSCDILRKKYAHGYGLLEAMGGGDLAYRRESVWPNWIVHKRHRAEMVLCAIHGHGSLWSMNSVSWAPRWLLNNILSSIIIRIITVNKSKLLHVYCVLRISFAFWISQQSYDISDSHSSYFADNEADLGGRARVCALCLYPLKGPWNNSIYQGLSSLSHSTSQSCLETHPPIIPILLTRKLRCSVLLRAAHSSLQQICPVSPPPAASRMSQMEEARFIAQERASQGLWAVSRILRQLPRDPVYWQGRRHTRPRRKAPGDAPCLHLQSLSLLLSHPQGSLGGAVSCHWQGGPVSSHFHGMSSSPGALVQNSLSTPALSWPPSASPLDSPTSGLLQLIHSAKHHWMSSALSNTGDTFENKQWSVPIVLTFHGREEIINNKYTK